MLRFRVSFKTALTPLLVMVCVCGGCVVFVPMRVPTHNQTAAWVPVQQKADLSFIRPGVTQREEVLQRLGWMNVATEDDRVFWGVWRTSSWWFLLAGLSLDGSGFSAERWWGYRTLVVEFDDRGFVERHASVKDDSQKLAQELFRVARERVEPLDLSAPITVCGLSPSRKTFVAQTFIGISTTEVPLEALSRYKVRAFLKVEPKTKIPQLDVLFESDSDRGKVTCSDFHDALIVFRIFVQSGARPSL